MKNERRQDVRLYILPFLPCNLEKQARNVYTNFARWKWKKEKGDKS